MSRPKLEYGRFSHRLIAFILDGVILGIPIMVITSIFITPFIIDNDMADLLNGSESISTEQISRIYNQSVYLQIAMVALWSFICALFVSSHIQTTPGKKMMNMKVVTSEIGRVSLLPAIGRYAAFPLIFLLLGAPDRYMVYENIESSTVSEIKLEDAKALKEIIDTPISSLTFIFKLLLICTWYLNISRGGERKAFHDILFDTRVIYASK